MDKWKVYTILDTKVGAYDKPWVMRSRGEALRGWSDLVNDDKTIMSKHPEDFILFEIGEYDLLSGVLFPLPHESLGKAIDFVNREGDSKLAAVR